jgi:hypothetical protein
VVTREGAALGVVPGTGAIAELRWAEAARGMLIAGAAAQDVTLAGLQLVHAALRRRKPVIVLDPGGAAIARALDAACAATGTPLAAVGASAAGPAVRVAATAGAGPGNAVAASASGLWGRSPAQEHEPGDPAAGELGRVVRERSAALLRADTTELAVRACTELASLAGDLRRAGVDGDALVWVPHGERVPAQALTELLSNGQDAGLCVMIGTTSPAAAAELGRLAGTALIYRVADPGMAASLALRTGTRLLPRSLAATLAGQRGGDADPRPPVPAPGDPGYASAPVHPAAPVPVVPPAGAAVDLVPGPVVPPRSLLALGQAEFVLAVSWPRQRLITQGRMVPARLPRAAPGRQGTPT